MNEKLKQQATEALGKWETEQLFRDPKWAETVLPFLLEASQNLDVYISYENFEDLLEEGRNLVAIAQKKGYRPDNFYAARNGILGQMIHFYTHADGTVEALFIETDKMAPFEKSDLFVLQKLFIALGYNQQKAVKVWSEDPLEVFAIKP
ncbi:hypothetical protein HYS10_00730 [Candidatus Collierbacteria bacterium]|nr:hypothetical protein [Candidatus Collierbacteria bacterium]